MAGNPWDNDPIVTPAPAPAPLPVSETQGIIERPGQPTPAYANVPAGGNPWDKDPIVTPAPAPKPQTAAEAASGPAANAVMAAAGGPLGVAPLLAAPVVGAVTGALSTGGAVRTLYDKMPDYAKYLLWQKLYEHLPGGKLLKHIHDAMGEGED